ncbi:MAG: phosphoribosylanthranilate isomerase [Actinomycetota bacterium]
MVWVKVCGVTDKDEALGISGLGTDALGFILSTDSRRRISTEKAEKIIGAVREKHMEKAPRMVGVFVNEDTGYVKEAAERLGLDMAQFSGHEDAAYLKEVKKLAAFEVIKAIPCKADTDAAWEIKRLEKLPDYYLLDTYSSVSYGGTGRTFDWSMAANLGAEKRIILAGGLGPDNVHEAVSAAGPFGVDASSALEAASGKKDMEKVREFIKNAKRNG